MAYFLSGREPAALRRGVPASLGVELVCELLYLFVVVSNMRVYFVFFAVLSAVLALWIGLDSIWGILFLIISIILFVITLIMQLFVSLMNSSSKDKNIDGKPGNYVYWDYESEPGCWAHNDSLFMMMVCRKDNTVLTDEMNTEEGWEIASSEGSEPEGACMEQETTQEVRKNGLQFEYNFCWKKKFDWLLKHDFVRMLYDKTFFESFLEKAKSGDADAQTLVGCCYGHNGMMATDVVAHNVDEALKWWHLAAEQGHKYAMREIALYHWHRGEQEEAKKWNEKGDLKIFIISRHSMDYLQSIDTDKEAEDKGQ